MIFVLMMMACVSPDRAEEALKDRGYTDIKIEGYAMFSCSEDDTFANSFTATSPDGKRKVKGAVCCGMMKGCTVRTW